MYVKTGNTEKAKPEPSSQSAQPESDRSTEAVTVEKWWSGYIEPIAHRMTLLYVDSFDIRQKLLKTWADLTRYIETGQQPADNAFPEGMTFCVEELLEMVFDLQGSIQGIEQALQLSGPIETENASVPVEVAD